MALQTVSWGIDMNKKMLVAFATAVYTGCVISCAEAVTVTDNFTGATANAANNWKAYDDACLTAGSGSGTIPACTSILASNSQTSQSVGSGALLLTPPSGGSEGAIISQNPFNASNGISVTFNTYTFGGGGYVGGYGNLTYPNPYGISQSTVTTNNSLDSNNGADSIGFYLINAVIGSTASEGSALTTSGTLSSTFALGATGGSFGYDCSNGGNGYNGMPAAYLGLTIDEFGNGVNPGDNTNTGPGFAPNSIAMRGYGDVNQLSIANALNAATKTTFFNTSNITTQDVAATCQNGGTYTYTPSNNGGDSQPSESSPSTTTITLPDYPYIMGSFAQLPANQLIANTQAQSRAQATPISYKLTITAAGLLSMEYSYNGGAYQQIINKQSITAGNGPLPSSLLFGFGASTGGAYNYHEITCFQAEPANQSNSSSSVNVQQSGELQTTTQVYLAYYSPNNWWGSLTAQLIQVNPSTGAITVDPTAEWDASCALTGGTCVATGATGMTAQPWYTLPVITWSGTGGVPFTWNNGINTTEQGWLNGDGASTPAYGFGKQLLHYLKGDTTYDATSFIASTTTPSFRTRTKILGDIVDSSPVWVGGPGENLPATFSDTINNPPVTFPENATGAQTYAQFATAESGRENVVYVGANDGMLHGFQAGSYSGTTYNSSTNNGNEVLAYVPFAVLQDFNKQVNTANDYAYPGYGHNFYVDATPGTGDVFYGGKWHTWLASGLGTGGRGLFVLDINTPANFSPSNAASLVKGDFTFANQGYNPTGPSIPTQMTCENGPATCSYQQTAGDIIGTPIIRLMNNGDYAIISGNGFNSDDGQAGIYIFLVDPTTGALSQTIFLGTGVGTAAAPDGIAYVSSADLNGNHIADYLYAGDEEGNLWRFNVISSDPTSWHASYYGQGTTPTPLFKTQTGQPITTQVLVDSAAGPSGAQQIMLQFGTGQQTPLTNISGAGYSPTAQSIYGVWDWDMSAWDALSGATRYSSLPISSSKPPTPLQYTNLQEQTLTTPGIASSGQEGVNLSANNVCWPGSASCSTTSTADPAYGWYVNLPSVSSNGTTLYQQVIYNPTIVEGSAVFDTTIPPYVNALTCNNGLQSGYTIAFNPLTGGPVANGFFRSSGNYGMAITMSGVAVSGLQLNATGSPSVLNANGIPIMVQQTVSGKPVVTEVAPGGGIGTEVNWAQLR